MGDMARRDRIGPWVSRCAALLALTLSLLVLLGWAVDRPGLIQLRPEWPAMTPWTALWMAFLSVGLLCESSSARFGRRRLLAAVGRTHVVVAGTTAVLVLAEYASDTTWIDTWWFAAAVAETRVGTPGRPSLSTTLTVLALAVLGLLIPAVGRWVRAAWIAGQAVALPLPLLAITGYTFGALELFATSVTNGMALTTAGGLLLVGLGTLAARPDLPMISELTDRPDRVTIQRLALVIAGIPVGAWLVRAAAATYLPGERDPWVVALVVVTVGVGLGVSSVSNRQQRDLLARVALSEEVKKSEARYRRLAAEATAERALLRVSSDALLDPQMLIEPRRDADGQIVDFTFADVNRAACEVLGRRRAELIGSSLRAGSPGVARADLISRYVKTAETGDPLELADYAYRSSPESDERIFDLNAVRVPDGRLSVTWRDVTAARRSARHLAESEQRYRLLAENTADVVALAVDGVVQFVSPAVTSALGWRPEELVGQPLIRYVHPDDRSRVLERRSSVEAGEAGRVRYRLLGRDSSYHWLEVAAAPYIGTSGEPEGVVANIRVIDEAVRGEEELRSAREAAEQAAEAKATFLANMSHEIRTPLTAVLGLLRLLHDSDQSPLQGDYTVRAQRSAEALLGILNDILDFSKIDARALVLHEQAFSLDTLLRNLGTILAASLGDKSVDLLFDLDPTTPDLVVGDELRIRQVLLNLCGNAVKFTDSGQIVLSTKVRRRTRDAVELVVRVEDTGVGMTPEVAAHVTESFVQGDPGIARRFGGTGLGLAITSRLLELMGSELQLTTALGIGSTFTFVLTLGTVGTPPDPPRQQLTAQPLRALVIGGRPALRDLLTRVCAQFGWSVQTRGAANRALDGTADATAADTFDVVLVDLSSPQVEGLGELRRDHPRGTALIALTTQSGVASLPEKDASLLDGYVIKPFTPSSLLDAVVSARGPGGGPSPSAGRRARVVPRLTGVRVLVVDDNETTREVAAEMLRHEEAVVRLASNGREAVDLVLADPAGVDVVLMDQQMPIMDGLAATRALRAHPAVDRLPVVALTANTTEADRRECLDAGMSDHLSKPFDLDDLVDRVRYWATLTPEAGAPNGTSRGPDVPQEAPAPGSATLDTAAALARVAGNEDFYARTLARFAGGLQERLTDIAAALAEDDRTRAARLAHTLSGAAATVGAMSLGEAARALEAALSEATDAGPARVALTDAAARTASAITAYVGDRAERVGNHLGS